MTAFEAPRLTEPRSKPSNIQNGGPSAAPSVSTVSLHPTHTGAIPLPGLAPGSIPLPAAPHGATPAPHPHHRAPNNASANRSSAAASGPSATSSVSATNASAVQFPAAAGSRRNTGGASTATSANGVDNPTDPSEPQQVPNILQELYQEKARLASIDRGMTNLMHSAVPMLTNPEEQYNSAAQSIGKVLRQRGPSLMLTKAPLIKMPVYGYPRSQQYNALSRVGVTMAREETLGVALEEGSLATHADMQQQAIQQHYQHAYEQLHWKPARRSTIARRLEVVAHVQPAAWGSTTGPGGDSDEEQEAPRRRRKPTVVWDRLSRQASQASQARGSRSGSTQSNGNGGTSSGGSSRAGSVPRIPALVKAGAGAGGSSRSSPANSSASSSGGGRGQALGGRTAGGQNGRQQQPRPRLGSGGSPPGSRNGRQGPTSRLATTASPVLRPAAAAAAAAAAAGRPPQGEHGVADAPPAGPSVSFDITPSPPPPHGLSVVDLLRGSPGSGQAGAGGTGLPFRRDARPTGAWVGGSGQQPQRTSGSNQAAGDEAGPGSPRFVHRVTLGLELSAAASQLCGNRRSTVNVGRPSTHGADGSGWEGRRSSNGRASGVLGSSADGAEWGQAAGGAWGGAHAGAMRGARKSTRVVLAGGLGGAAHGQDGGAAVGPEQRQWVASTTQGSGPNWISNIRNLMQEIEATNANMSPYLQSFRSHRKSVYARTAAASGAGEAGGPEGAAAASGTAGGGGVVLGGGAAGRRPRASAVAGAS